MNTSSNEDPYDMFGSDNDDDDDNVDGTIYNPEKITKIAKNCTGSIVQSLAQTLKDNANQRNSDKIQLQQQQTQELISEQQQQDVGITDSNITSSNSSKDTTTNYVTISSPWDKSYQPLYVGPINIIQSTEYGGNRALVATQLLQPGTLVLVEQPIFTWLSTDATTGTTTSNSNTNTNNHHPNIDYLNPTMLQRLIQQQHQQQQQEEESKFKNNRTNIVTNSIGNSTETTNNNTTTTTDNNTAATNDTIINVLHCIEFLHPTKIIVDQYLMVNDNSGDDSKFCDVVRIKDPTTGSTITDDDEIQIIRMILSLQEQQKQLQNIKQQPQSLPSDEKKTTTSLDKKNKNMQEQEVQVNTCTDDDWNIDNLYEIVQYMQHNTIYNSNGTLYTRLDLYRTIVAIRYNGLQSGIYLYSALMNHNDIPNCVKFLPNNKVNQSISNQSNSNNIVSYYSEIRTTRHVQIGEVLTISYIPTIISYISRQQYLWKQHKFDISKLIRQQEQQEQLSSSTPYKMELIKGQFPIVLSSSSSLSQPHTKDNDMKVGIVTTNDDNPITSIVIDDLFCIVKNIEKSITDLNDMYNDAYDTVQIIVKQQQKSQLITTKKKSTIGSIVSIDYSIFDHCAALEQSIYELYNESTIQLQNNIHILLIPCLVLHLDVCYLLLQYTLLDKHIRYKIYVRMIYTCQRLITIQCLYYGNNNHYNLARTYLDLANAIDSLLTNSNQSLSSIGKTNNNSTTSTTADSDNANGSSMDDDIVNNNEYDWPTSISAWSSFEYKARVEYNRIKALYPHDVEQYIHQ